MRAVKPVLSDLEYAGIKLSEFKDNELERIACHLSGYCPEMFASIANSVLPSDRLEELRASIREKKEAS